MYFSTLHSWNFIHNWYDWCLVDIWVRFYQKIPPNGIKIKQSSTLCISIHCIPANSRTLCASLMPADPKLWSHAFRPIFNCLTDNRECYCLKSIQFFSVKRKSSELFNNGWKSFENRWPCPWSRQKSFYTFGYLRKLSGNLRQILSLEVVWNLR